MADQVASHGLDRHALRRRSLQVLGLAAVLVLVAVAAPGLGDVRDQLGRASPGWIVVAIALEAASCGCYVLLFRPVFCRRMSWRLSSQIGLSEVGMGSIVPASGIGGVALGAWLLSNAGMGADRIARRSVAFLLIKSSVNFVAVAVIGVLAAFGLLGPQLGLSLTLLPAVVSVALLVLVAQLARIEPDVEPRRASKLQQAARAVGGGVRESGALIREHDRFLVIGAVGYWAFDNAVLWAAFESVGDAPAASVLLLGYLIGQLGGLLPIPGGIGAIDGGLIGTLVVYGAPASTATAAVLVYRTILFGLPIVLGAVAFATLRRDGGLQAGSDAARIAGC